MKRLISSILPLCLLLYGAAVAGAQNPRPSMRPNQGQRQFDISQLPSIGVLTGTVIDTLTGDPVEYATVKVTHRLADTIITGGITDDKGRFRIEQIKLGPHIVEIAFMGFETKTIRSVRLGREGTEVDLGTIYIYPAAYALEQVEVKGTRSFMTNAIDRKIFDPSQLIESQTGSASDVLDNIPSVEVDVEGNITLRGSGNVRILIDGRPSRFTGEDLAALLEQLPGNTIDRVELITNPSAKYEPDGMAGIINIVMKKNALRGFNGSLNSGYGGRDRFNTGANLNYKINQVNLFANYGYRQGTFFGGGSSYRQSFFDLDTTLLFTDNSSEHSRNGHFLKAGLDYEFAPKWVLTLEGTYSDRQGPGEEYLDSRTLDSDLSYLYGFSRSTESNRGGQNFNSGVVLTRTFDSPQHQFVFNANYTVGDNENTRTFEQINRDALGSPLSEDLELTQNLSFGNRHEWNISGDYTHPLSEDSKLELGFRSILRDDRDDFHALAWDIASDGYVEDFLQSNDFLYREHIHAAYGTYGNKWGKFGYQLGLRLEHVFMDSELKGTEEFFENDYFSVYPSLHLGYSLAKDQELMLSYSRRVDRPRGRQLNPFEDRSDPQNLRRGNPFLLPEYTNAFELGYSKYWKGSSLVSSIYYRHTDDVISVLREVNSDGISLTTYDNFNSSDSYGVEFIFATQFLRRFNMNSSFNIFQSTLNGTNVNESFNNDAWGYSGRLTLNGRLWKGGTVQLMGRYRGRRVLAQGEIKPIAMMGLGLRQMMLDNRLTISLNTRDLFNSMRFEFITEGANFYQESMHRRSNRIVFLSLSYRFGEMQRNMRNRRRGQGEENGDMGEEEIEVF